MWEPPNSKIVWETAKIPLLGQKNEKGLFGKKLLISPFKFYTVFSPRKPDEKIGLPMDFWFGYCFFDCFALTPILGGWFGFAIALGQ